MTDLEILIGVVQNCTFAGTDDSAVSEETSNLIVAVVGEDLSIAFVRACAGSLDAAASLHAALLPGWNWQRQGLAIIVSTDSSQWEGGQYGYGSSAVPARAWVLAILGALDHRR